MVTKK